MKDPAESFPVLFLSQNEIIKIAESEDEQIEFLDRFFDFRAYQQEITTLGETLEEQDLTLAQSLNAVKAQAQIESSIGAAKKEIAVLDAALKNPIFDEFSKLEVKDRCLREQQTFVASAIEQLDAAGNEFEEMEAPVLPDSCSGDPLVKRVSKCYALFSDRIFPFIGVVGISAEWPGWHRNL